MMTPSSQDRSTGEIGFGSFSRSSVSRTLAGDSDFVFARTVGNTARTVPGDILEKLFFTPGKVLPNGQRDQRNVIKERGQDVSEPA